MGSKDNHAAPPPKQELSCLPPDGGRHYNRLVFQKSPYLLQHATNPVEWYAWGREAFRRARREERPLFVSIGYSTCRWCHVMARESFEDLEVARVLNEHYVAVKVDREERPDVDQVYMSAARAMGAPSGWPLNVVTTPEGEPFYAATYLPPRGRGKGAGLVQVLQHLARLWQSERRKVLGSARQITEQLRTGTAVGDALPGRDLLSAAAARLRGFFDPRHGGFGTEPKFPSPHTYLFLLRWWQRSGEEQYLRIVEKSLSAMRSGGLFDQVGFGFHRYSTDARWLVPHFEKMLYDQAMLMLAYTETAQATGNDYYGRVARETAEYLLREMRAPGGGFYAAEDAETEGQEGLFYLWSLQEWKEVLGPEDGELFAGVFGLEPEGNFRDESTGQRTGRNIPHLRRPLEQVARERGLQEGELSRRWDRARERLLAARKGRTRPHRDEKILTAWNGLTVAALARAGWVLDEPSYLQAGASAADFVLQKMRRCDGRLLRYHRDGSSPVPAFSQDYAFLAWGLLELYEAGFEPARLRTAMELSDQMLDLFRPGDGGPLVLNGKDAENLITRPRQMQDGALPSANSVALLNLLRLAHLTGRAPYREAATELMGSIAAEAGRAPAAFAMFLVGADYALGPQREIVIAAGAPRPDPAPMLGLLRGRFMPRTAVLVRRGEGAHRLAQLAQFTGQMDPAGGHLTAYPCEERACREPVTTPTELESVLENWT